MSFMDTREEAVVDAAIRVFSRYGVDLGNELEIFQHGQVFVQ